MKRFHRLSGLLIATFVVLHLTNHLLSLVNPETHIRFMEAARVIYRNSIAEAVLLTAIGWQVASGLALFRRTTNTAHTGADRWQRWSGLYLAGFFLIHLSAVFVGRYVLRLDTNLYFGAAGLNTFPHLLFFVPYYGLAILAVFVHLAAVHQKKMTASVLGFSPRQQARLIVALGTLLMLSTLYGLTNGFHGLAVPSHYGILVGK